MIDMVFLAAWLFYALFGRNSCILYRYDDIRIVCPDSSAIGRFCAARYESREPAARGGSPEVQDHIPARMPDRVAFAQPFGVHIIGDALVVLRLFLHQHIVGEPVGDFRAQLLRRLDLRLPQRFLDDRPALCGTARTKQLVQADLFKNDLRQPRPEPTAIAWFCVAPRLSASYAALSAADAPMQAAARPPPPAAAITSTESPIDSPVSYKTASASPQNPSCDVRIWSETVCRIFHCRAASEWEQVTQ